MVRSVHHQARGSWLLVLNGHHVCTPLSTTPWWPVSRWTPLPGVADEALKVAAAANRAPPRPPKMTRRGVATEDLLIERDNLGPGCATLIKLCRTT
jgi:hypothetical protein